MNWEFVLLDFIREYLSTKAGDIFMPFISSLGNSGMIWILISAILCCTERYRKVGIASLLSLVLMLLIGNISLKSFFARPRPFIVHPEIPLIIPPPSGYSFPSGHSFSSFASATVLFYGSKKIGIPALILAGLIAFSRLYLYVHFPTDVLAGSLLGVLTATITWKFICYLWEKKKFDRASS